MYKQIQYNNFITVITPVYNTGKLLYETYDSLQHQTWKFYTWILVNDGSEDDETNNILVELSKKDHRIKLIEHVVNKGLPASRNTGIQNAESPYVFFLDADDLIQSGFLEKAYLILETNREYKFVNSWVVGFGAQQYKWTGGFHDKELFLKENRNTSCFMARREVFETLLFDENMRNGCEDWDFWLNAASLNYWGYTIPEYLFFYRRTPKSKWNDLSNPAKLELIKQQLNAKYASKLKAQGFPDPRQVSYEFGIKNILPIAMPETTSLEEGTGTILCLFPWLEMGGADLYNLRLLTQLSKNGWNIIILTTLKSNHTLSHSFEEITSHVFHLANLGDDYLFNIWISYFIETRIPDVIFLSNSMYGYYLLPWLKVKYPAIPVVDYVHSEDPGWYNGGYPFFSASYTNCLAQTFVSSNQLGNWCIERGSDRKKIEICYINVDTENVKRDPVNREKIRKQLQLTPTTCLILYVARLTPQKQPEMVANVIAKIGNIHRDYKCIIIGEGPEQTTLLRNIRNQKLEDRILFLGPQPNKIVLDYMDAADIFFLPSLYEGIALSIYEAMAKSLAILGADTGGQSELVTDSCGILVKETTKEKETEKYAIALTALINAPEDITKKGEASRQRVVDHFDNKMMISKIHEALLKLKSYNFKNSSNVFSDEYMIALDRLLYLEKANATMYSNYNNRAYRIIQRNKKTLDKARMAYHKFKHFLNNIISK